MRTEFVTIDNVGRSTDVGSQGYGFRIVPARPPPDRLQSPYLVRPGSFPVTVRLDSGPELVITSSAGFHLRERFKSLVLLGEEGDCWQVQIFEDPGENVSSPPLASVAVQVQPPTVLPTVTPTGKVGTKTRAGTLSHTFYASGTLGQADLYVRSAAGNWYYVETIDFALSPVQTRVTYASADRIFLRNAGAGAGMLIEIDAEVTTG